MKNCLRKKIRRRILHQEEFVTLSCEIEAVINSGPLTFLYKEPNSIVLKPLDFLQPGLKLGFIPIDNDGQDKIYTPPGERDEVRDYFEESTRLLDQFWKFWSEKYLLSLREHQKMLHKTPRVKTEEVPRVGDTVLIRKENITRDSWKLARIIQLTSSDDKLIRSIKLKLLNGKEIVKPINLLYPVETSR